MNVRGRVRPTGVAGPILLGVMALMASAAGAVVAADDWTLLFPPDKAVVTTGTFRVIVKGGGDGALKVNGQPACWEPFQPPLRVAKVGLRPGLHELDIGGRKVAFAVGVKDDHEGPREWPVVRAHLIPIDRLCSACHQTEKAANGRTAVGTLKGTDSCYVCHRRDDIVRVHEEVVDLPEQPAAKTVGKTAAKETPKPILQQIDSCRTCHALHGSPRKALLKPSAK